MFKYTKEDVFFMHRALTLAKRGAKKVSPNPMVGAVLVKNGKIIAEGYHRSFGGPHAEVEAVKNMTSRQVHGSTLYVTLEPCNHYGKTFPCTNFLISKGLKHLILAMRDPNPLVSGNGIKQLKNSGVNVLVGVLKEEAEDLNKVFIKNIIAKLPFVSMKLGVTLDAKIAPLHAKSLYYINNQKSLQSVHRMRSETDAILTTSETIMKDNPHLGVRFVRGKDPLRVVIDSKLRTDPGATVYRDKNVVVATTLASSSVQRKLFVKHGIELLVYKGSHVPLKRLLQDLYKRGVYNLMTEAGAKLVTSLLNQRLADELVLFFSPKILGRGIPWIYQEGFKKLNKPVQLEKMKLKRFDNDIMMSGKVLY